MRHIRLSGSVLPECSANYSPFRFLQPSRYPKSSMLVLTRYVMIFSAPTLAQCSQSGGEFGVWSPGNPGFGLPGRFGVDYAFINKVFGRPSPRRSTYSQSTIDIFVDQEKINVFRVTFLMERLAPLEYGLGRRFNETVSNLDFHLAFIDDTNSSTSERMRMRSTTSQRQKEFTPSSIPITTCATSRFRAPSLTAH